eukprot:353803-Chlamydomonas_euryale.AAC.4
MEIAPKWTALKCGASVWVCVEREGEAVEDVSIRTFRIYRTYGIYGRPLEACTGPVPACPHLRAALQPYAAEPAPNALPLVLDAYMAPPQTFIRRTWPTLMTSFA